MKGMSVSVGASGARLYPEYFSHDAQAAIVAAIRGILAAAPLYTARMPRSGQPMSVCMSNFGSLGWFLDEAGYRYQNVHAHSDSPLPAIPDVQHQLWADVRQ